MRATEAVQLLAGVADMGPRASSEEVMYSIGWQNLTNAQGVGMKLAALERQGLVESERMPWGKVWMLSETVVELLEGRAHG